jgi:hypothetical protein
MGDLKSLLSLFLIFSLSPPSLSFSFSHSLFFFLTLSLFLSIYLCIFFFLPPLFLSLFLSFCLYFYLSQFPTLSLSFSAHLLFSFSLAHELTCRSFFGRVRVYTKRLLGLCALSSAPASLVQTIRRSVIHLRLECRVLRRRAHGVRLIPHVAEDLSQVVRRCMCQQLFFAAGE